MVSSSKTTSSSSISTSSSSTPSSTTTTATTTSSTTRTWTRMPLSPAMPFTTRQALPRFSIFCTVISGFFL